ELVVGYAVAVLEIIDALLPCDVEQYAEPRHLGARVLDAELGESVAIDESRVVAVIRLVIQEDMAERIPVGRGLHRHVDGIVGVEQLALPTGGRIGSGRQHGVDRVPASAEQAGLRTVAVERNAERE